MFRASCIWLLFPFFPFDSCIIRKVSPRIQPLGLELLCTDGFLKHFPFLPVFFRAFCVPVSFASASVSSLVVLWGSQAESCSFLSCSEGTSQPDSMPPNLPPKCISRLPWTFLHLAPFMLQFQPTELCCYSRILPVCLEVLQKTGCCAPAFPTLNVRASPTCVIHKIFVFYHFCASGGFTLLASCSQPTGFCLIVSKMLLASSQYSPWTPISNFFTMLCVLEVLAAFPPGCTDIYTDYCICRFLWKHCWIGWGLCCSLRAALPLFETSFYLFTLRGKHTFPWYMSRIECMRMRSCSLSTIFDTLHEYFS